MTRTKKPIFKAATSKISQEYHVIMGRQEFKILIFEDNPCGIPCLTACVLNDHGVIPLGTEEGAYFVQAQDLTCLQSRVLVKLRSYITQLQSLEAS